MPRKREPVVTPVVTSRKSNGTLSSGRGKRGQTRRPALQRCTKAGEPGRLRGRGALGPVGLCAEPDPRRVRASRRGSGRPPRRHRTPSCSSVSTRSFVAISRSLPVDLAAQPAPDTLGPPSNEMPRSQLGVLEYHLLESRRGGGSAALEHAEQHKRSCSWVCRAIKLIMATKRKNAKGATCGGRTRRTPSASTRSPRRRSAEAPHRIREHLVRVHVGRKQSESQRPMILGSAGPDGRFEPPAGTLAVWFLAGRRGLPDPQSGRIPRGTWEEAPLARAKRTLAGSGRVRRRILLPLPYREGDVNCPAIRLRSRSRRGPARARDFHAEA